MNKLEIQCFDNETELVSFICDGSKMLEFGFSEKLDGYLLIGHIYQRFEGESCKVSLCNLPDGEYTPKLVLEDRTLELPRLKKELGVISPVKYDLEYMRDLSLRAKRADEKIKTLERKIEHIEKKIWGESIF